jgi:arginine decarboxylase-like protein
MYTALEEEFDLTTITRLRVESKLSSFASVKRHLGWQIANFQRTTFKYTEKYYSGLKKV